MFLLPIIVPIYVDGDRSAVTTEWKRSLELLRDSLPRHLLPIVVLAPHLPAAPASSSQRLEALGVAHDGIELVAPIAWPPRARHYWLHARAQWREEARRQVERATVVQSGLDDLFRPLMFDALKIAFARGKTTVFVEDTDVVVQTRELAEGRSVRARWRAEIYARSYERQSRWCVARASVSLLKGQGLMRRYASFAAHAHEFHDTSYTRAEIVPMAQVAARAATLASDRPLRLVYCGRLVARKGLGVGLDLLHAARARGAALELDVIGDGDERVLLVERARELGLSQHVRFLGAAPYGPKLLLRLAQYDALYFTPLAEDTPRMIFDGYAAGLPLLGSDVGYVRERAQSERATLLLPRRDRAAAVDALVRIDRERGRLAELACRAHAAAHHHAADRWYERRAQWVMEALARDSSICA